MKACDKGDRGEKAMALLLVIALLGLVTLLVLSLAAITRVEVRTGATVGDAAVARAHALTGLGVALGELQRHAGLDTRITAVSGAVLDGAQNPHWTGVWDEATGRVAWLVSGAAPDPAEDPDRGRRQVVLVAEQGPGEAGRRTSAPFEAWGDGEEEAGGFAYVILDQGVKATVGEDRAAKRSGELSSGIYGGGPDALPGQRLARMGGGSAWIPGPDGRPLFSDDERNAAAQLAVLEQVSVASPVADAGWVRRHWHDYAVGVTGLLVDPVRARLKRDLTVAADAVLPGLEAWQALMTAERAQSATAAFPLRGRPAGAAGGAIDTRIAPVLTQLGLQFSIHTISATSRTLEVRLRFFVELVNPYASPLAAETLRLVIGGLPGAVRIESRTAGTDAQHGEAVVDLGAAYARHQTADGAAAVVFDLPVEAESWPPGRVFTWRLPTGDAMDEPSNRRLVFDAASRTSYWRTRPGVGLDGPDPLSNTSELRFTSDESWRLHFELRRENGDRLLSGQWPAFAPVETTWLDANSTLPDFGLEVRLVDRSDGQDADGASDWWLAVAPGDVRVEELGEGYWVPTIDLETASYREPFAPPNSAVEARQLYNRDPVDRPALVYYQPGYNSDVVLHELPRQEWVSVGGLQHLPFADGRPQDVGNSWSSRNDWFDRYFFSTLPSETRPTAVMANPNLVRVGAGRGMTDADLRAEPDRLGERLAIPGAFNVNSANSTAWRAVLAGVAGMGQGLSFDANRHDAATGAVDGRERVELAGGFGRFAQGLGEVWQSTPNPANLQAPLRMYRRGWRELNHAQVARLADHVAAAVQQRLRARGPYFSLAEWLAPEPLWGDANALEYAIREYDAGTSPSERLRWDGRFPDAPLKVDRAAPGWLSAADLMTALAPVATVRSDTFLIRAYGEAGPAGSPRARRWLEARAQRQPQGVDPAEFMGGEGSDWVQQRADARWGRRFEIVTLRWLTEDDL